MAPCGSNGQGAASGGQFHPAIDGNTPDSAPKRCPTCDNLAIAGRHCPHCGTEIASGRTFATGRRPEKTTRQAMRVMFAPVFEYFEHFPSLIAPRHLAGEIRERQFTGVNVIGLWVAASLLAALAGAVVPNGVARVEIPILAEVIEALLAMGIMTLFYGALHFLLRRGHRDVTFREYLIATLAVGGLLWPWQQLGQGIAMRFGVAVVRYNNIALLVAAPFYARAFAALYRQRLLIVIAWIAAYAVMASAAALLLRTALQLHQKPVTESAASGRR